MNYMLFAGVAIVGYVGYKTHWNWFAMLVVAGVVVGFTLKQRKWFHKRDGNQCMFHYKQGGHWVRCKNRRNLEVHHLIPRGWAAENMPPDFPLNSAGNGIVLCSMHHVGEGMKPEKMGYVIHPDTEKAHQAFKGGDKEAYDNMMDVRRDKNKAGIPYWNTRWDWMLRRLIDRNNSKWASKGGEQFPQNGRRGENGRLK